jgi:ParB family chromosome partitioning protein
MGHARALAGVDDILVQLSLYKDITQKGLSVRQIEEIVSKLGQKKSGTVKSNTSAAGLDPEIKKMQDKMSSYLSTKVIIKPSNGGKGEIVLQYYTHDDLDRIVELMQ